MERDKSDLGAWSRPVFLLSFALRLILARCPEAEGPEVCLVATFDLEQSDCRGRSCDSGRGSVLLIRHVACVRNTRIVSGMTVSLPIHMREARSRLREYARETHRILDQKDLLVYDIAIRNKSAIHCNDEEIMCKHGCLLGTSCIFPSHRSQIAYSVSYVRAYIDRRG